MNRITVRAFCLLVSEFVLLLLILISSRCDCNQMCFINIFFFPFWSLCSNSIFFSFFFSFLVFVYMHLCMWCVYVHTCLWECRLAHTTTRVWRPQNNYRCWSMPSNWLETCFLLLHTQSQAISRRNLQGASWPSVSSHLGATGPQNKIELPCGFTQVLGMKTEVLMFAQ